ncbi:MAG: 50S ribosomal protein L31 [Alphaproteobacteria bacterium]|nr:50S ribosomal protein L31 [Alphaproteobacteria bacterium]
MKKEGHPDYHFINVKLNDGSTYWTRSTYGAEGQQLTLEIDTTTHSVWTGAQAQIMDRGGRVGRFKKRYEGLVK